MDSSSKEAREAKQPGVPRPRISNACEACRAAKVKCQSSNQLGICKRLATHIHIASNYTRTLLPLSSPLLSIR